MSEAQKPFYPLAPTLLLSMPQLPDPNFRRAVILLCKHTPDGAFGLILNRPLEAAIDQERQWRLWAGGPVEPERGWLLLGEEPSAPEAIRIVDGMYLSTSPALLRQLLENPPPARSRLLIGYAGWGPGQLDAEFQSSAWLTTEVELDLVFDVPASEMWETAIRRLGADPSALQMSQGVH